MLVLAAACYFVYTRGSQSGTFGANQKNESCNVENPMFDRSEQQKSHYMDVQGGPGLGGYVDVAPNSQRASGYMDICWLKTYDVNTINFSFSI